MLSLAGCAKAVKTAPLEVNKADFSGFYAVSADFDKTASNEIEASLMLWDLYAYIKELENKLKICVESR